jgi:hypothetical protein
MLKKLKNKICEIICKIFKITPCVCDHEVIVKRRINNEVKKNPGLSKLPKS